MEGVHCSFVIHMARPGEGDKAWTHGMAENRAVGVVDLWAGRQLLRKAVSFWLLCLPVTTGYAGMRISVQTLALLFISTLFTRILF
jgi:hypothetical protein